MYTVKSLASLLNVTTRTIRNYQMSGQLTGHKVGGQWHFSKDEVSKLIDDLGSEKSLSNKIERYVFNFMANPPKNKTLTIINVSSTTPDVLQQNKNSIIQEYNELYEGKNRVLLYEYIDSTNCRFLLSGNISFVIALSEFIKKIFS